MRRIVFGLMIIVFSMIWSCRPEPDQNLLILHAGSLSVPFKQMSQAFMEEYPGITVRTEAAGSRTCARKITELNSPADVMASADSEVIKSLLIPDYADYCIDFATNEMVIMYREDSPEANRLTEDNWFEIILRPEIEYGHSDPNADPCGYRTMLTWQLAEMYYKVPGLYHDLISNRPLKNIRPKEVDLLSLLEISELDYIFIYRSVAEQHHGRYLLLPVEINLKSFEHAAHYQTVSVELTGRKPGETIIRKGAPMVYGMTIPKTAQNPELAVKFIAFVLGSEGQRIMQENGQPEFVPARVDRFDTLPSELKRLVRAK